MSLNQVCGVASDRYGQVTGGSSADMTGRQLLQGTVDACQPQAPTSQVMTFWLVEAPRVGRQPTGLSITADGRGVPRPRHSCLKPGGPLSVGNGITSKGVMSVTDSRQLFHPVSTIV